MRSSWQRVAVAVALATAVAGCSEKTTGNASAGTPSSSSEKALGSEKPTSSSKPAVNRPKALNVKGVDPCALVTDAQKQQLVITRTPQKSKSSTAYPGVELCSISAQDFSFGVSFVATDTQGIDRYANGRVKGEVTPVQVAGYPAYLAKPPAPLDNTCFLGIDVSDGQIVDIQVRSDEGIPREQLCQKVQTVGQAVITTLTSR
jgi:hypothetical protein